MHKLSDNISFGFDIGDLASTIASGKAVVYTGAGTSIPARLPGWRDFLTNCLDRAKNSRLESDDIHTEGWWKKAEDLMRQEDYLTSAGILQQVIGQSLERYVWDTFGMASEPTAIHRAIARIPFSIAITTNYDRLLESAYPSRPNVWTWRDPEALFSSIKHRRFSVVKIHGDVGNGPSLVLTKNQYRDLMHLNKSFNECLTSLLSLRSFLFVGTSLKDHDLTRLMDMAKLTYGADFGPHYAICFEKEVDRSIAELLKDSYNIHCVICSGPEGSSDWMTESVTSFLTYLSGKVSKYQASRSISLAKLEHPVFNLREASRDVATTALTVTAGDRCRLAFVREPKLPALQLISELSRGGIDTTSSMKDPFSDPGQHISPHGYLGGLFLSFLDAADKRYVADVDVYLREDYQSQKKHDQITGYSDSLSVLTVPIFADGERVGVLSVESSSRDAFTSDHLLGLQDCSKAAGAMYLEYRHRQRSADAVRPYLESPSDFEATMNRSRQVKNLELNFILYEIDYASGQLYARYSDSVQTAEDRPFSYSFYDSSLASRVFRNKKAEYVKPSETEKLSMDGVEFFGIYPPVFATPVRVNGAVSTVLVCWSRKKEVEEFVGDQARIASLASLVANSPELAIGQPERRRAQQFVTRLNRSLKSVDGGKNWTREQMRSEDFKSSILRVAMETLLDKSCGFGRVRYWEREAENDCPRFKLVSDVSRTEGKGSLIWNSYSAKGVFTGDDDYCRYTMRRSKIDFFESAQFQHQRMFGSLDPNCVVLDKDPEGLWLVAPIKRDGFVHAFFSADNHWQGKERKEPEEVLELQRCALDVAVRLVEKIILYQAVIRNKRH